MNKQTKPKKAPYANTFLRIGILATAVAISAAIYKEVDAPIGDATDKIVWPIKLQNKYVIIGYERDKEKVSAIEREFGHMDRWVGNHFVNNDFAQRRGEVTIAVWSKWKLMDQKAFGYMENDGEYLPLDKILIATSPSAIPHEAAHVLYDYLKMQEGGTAQKFYITPSIKEIDAFAQKKVSSAQYDGIKTNIQIRLDTSEINRITERWIEKIIDTGILKMQADDASGLFKKLQEDSRDDQLMLQRPYGSMPQNERVIQASNEIASLFGVADQITLKYDKKMTELKAHVKEANAEQPSQARQELSGYLLEFERLELASNLNRLTKTICDESTISQGSYFTNQLQALQRQLKGAKNEAEKQSIELEISALVRLNALELDQINRTRTNSYYEFTAANSMADPITKMVDNITDSNERELANVIGSSNEIMARIVDSLYSLYLGRPQMNNYPLSESDLEFLSRYKSIDGDVLFKNGIEKYRLALQMQKDGVAPDEITSKLRYATRFKYGGKEYSWPETQFRLLDESVPIIGVDHSKSN